MAKKILTRHSRFNQGGTDRERIVQYDSAWKAIALMSMQLLAISEFLL